MTEWEHDRNCNSAAEGTCECVVAVLARLAEATALLERWCTAGAAERLRVNRATREWQASRALAQPAAPVTPGLLAYVMTDPTVVSVLNEFLDAHPGGADVAERVIKESLGMQPAAPSPTQGWPDPTEADRARGDFGAGFAATVQPYVEDQQPAAPEPEMPLELCDNSCASGKPCPQPAAPAIDHAAPFPVCSSCLKPMQCLTDNEDDRHPLYACVDGSYCGQPAAPEPSAETYGTPVHKGFSCADTELGHSTWMYRAESAEAQLAAVRRVAAWSLSPAEPETDDDGPLYTGMLTDPGGSWVRVEDLVTILNGSPPSPSAVPGEKP